MRVVVTGASGFLGSWICRVLAQKHEVVSLVRPTSDTYRLNGIEKLEIVAIENSEWAAFIATCKPDALILTDWWGVGNHDRNDEHQFENVERMESLTKAAKDAGVGILIGVGSQAELGPVSDGITEDLPDNPTTKYGAAKVATRKAMQEILKGSPTRFTWMRIFSTYGPRMKLKDGLLLPDFITNALEGKDLVIYGNNDVKQTLCYVTDTIDAVVRLMKSDSDRHIFNIGSEEQLKMSEVAGQIIRMTESNSNVVFEDPLIFLTSKGIPDLTLAKDELGWIPLISLSDGLQKTIDYTTANKKLLI